MPSAEELREKSREARESRNKARKLGLRETHQRINSIDDQPSWLLGVVGVAVGRFIAMGTPVV